MEFYERLRQLRRERGLTQQELGDELYVNRSVISRWENGERYPSVEDLKNISLYFNVSLDDLIGSEIKEYSENSPICPDPRIELVVYGSLFTLLLVLLLLEAFCGKHLITPGESRVLLFAEHILLLVIYAYCMYISFENNSNPRITGWVILIQYIFPALNNIIVNTVVASGNGCGLSYLLERVISIILLWGFAGYGVSRFFFRPEASDTVTRVSIIAYTLLLFVFTFSSYHSITEVFTFRFVYECIRMSALLLQSSLALYYVTLLKKKREKTQSN